MDEIDRFIKDIDDLYGTYLDSGIGYSVLETRWKRLNPNPESTLFIGHGEPNNPETYPLHSVKFKDLFKRNGKNGDNIIRIGNMFISTIYQLWEDNYRSAIAKRISKSKNDIQSNIFGELRHIRNAIIHNNGKRTSDFEKLICFKFLNERDEVRLTDTEVENIINLLKAELRILKTKYNV
jgi:hypothetical protein